jgi:hypothetical protein
VLFSLSLAVVGSQYPNEDKKAPTRLFAIGLCRPGDTVQLVPEPKNKHDDQAIMVWNADGMMMGYISAERAPLIHKMLREGREVTAIFQVAVENGAWIRAAFDGEEPSLPEPREPARSPESRAAFVEPDFYPDDTYPDD